MSKKNNRKQGFSLIQISMLIAVSGIILASVLPAGEMGSDIEKERITQKKMEKIEEATQAFMMGNLRRPCPADGTLTIGDANFGKENPNSGSCSGANFFNMTTPLTMTATTTSGSAIVNIGGGSDLNYVQLGMLVTGTDIADNSHVFKIMTSTQMILDKPAATSGTNTITFRSLAAGVVPVRSLGLSDDYMLDGYGRRITYVVDIRATDQTTCRDMATTKSPGLITVKDNFNYVMWTLISHGRNGHGAFPAQGSSVANRINSGSTSTDERINAFVDASFNPTFGLDSTGAGTSYGTFIAQSAPVYPTSISSFDDIVWYKEETKNTCCTGKICHLGTRIDKGADDASQKFKIGDVNGDKINDIITYSNYSPYNYISVIFGSTTGLPPTAGLKLSSANSNRFITITDDSALPGFAADVEVGDINGDGFDDIAFTYGNTTNSYIKVFYGSSTPQDTNTSAISSTITLPPATTVGNSGANITLGNFANTNKKDILIQIGNSSLDKLYLIYGSASPYSMTAESVTTTASTVGFRISSPFNNTIGEAGDVNSDGYDDIIIGNYTNFKMYILFGQSPANWNTDKTTAATGSSPDIVDMATRVTAGATEAVQLTGSSLNQTDIGRYTIAVADMNNDGYKDILFNNTNIFNIIYGKAAGSWANINLTIGSAYNGTLGFRLHAQSSRPSWLSVLQYAMAKDVNNDGKVDIVFTNRTANPYGLGTYGSTFVALQPSSGWSSIWNTGTILLFQNIFTSAGLPVNNDANKGYRIDGCNPTSYAGQYIDAADVNNDGKNDILLNSMYGPDGASINIFFGRTNVPWSTTTSICWLN